MAIIIDHYTGGQAAGASSCTVSVEVTNHPNRILLACIGQDRDNNSANCDVSSVTYGGNPLTKAIDGGGREGNISENAEIWYLLNPTVGTANLVANFPDNGNSENVMWGVDMWGAKQVVPEATGLNVTISSTVSTTVTTVKSTALIIAMYSHNNQTWDIDPDSGITELVEAKGNGGCSVAIHYKQTTSPGGYSIGASANPGGTPIVFALAAAAFTPIKYGGGIIALL